MQKMEPERKTHYSIPRKTPQRIIRVWLHASRYNGHLRALGQQDFKMSKDCSYNELYPLQVLDDSMEPEFPEKCIIVLEPSEVCASGAFVLAEVNGERWFRQYLSEGDKGRKLVALKESIPDIPLENTDFKVLGVVVQRNIGRKIKHYQPYVPGGGSPKAAELS
jgi:hypothetical protein